MISSIIISTDVVDGWLVLAVTMNHQQQQPIINATVFSDPESDLTGNLSGPRKRTRVSPPLPLPHHIRFPATADKPAATSTSGRATAAALAQDLAGCLHQQGLEIDELVRLHGETMLAGLQDAMRRQWRAMAAAESAVVQRLREKEAELEATSRRNAELEEKVRQLAAENQVWYSVAKNNEAVVAGLRTSLDQLLHQSAAPAAACDEGYGDSSEVVVATVADDAQSSCHAGYDASDVPPFNHRRRTCRVCGKNEVSVLLLPCRHLCMCKDCEPTTATCPACQSAKDGRLHIFLS